jgi:hypothetical protein
MLAAMAARPRSPTRWLNLLSALGVASACSDPCEDQGFTLPPEPDPTAGQPPQVLAGEWIGPGVLELSFSKPLMATGDLDPARFAVVGWNAVVSDYAGIGQQVGECYLVTRYRELGAGYYYYQPTSIAAVWIGPEDDTLLRLRLTSSAAQCPTSSNSAATGIMLVYTDANDPSAGVGLLDENGIRVPDIGPAWAVQDLDSCFTYTYCGSVSDYAAGHLPQISSLAPIPCPS